MAADEYSLLQCLDLGLPVQIDNSIEQEFLFYEKERIYPAVVNVIYEHEKSQQNSEEVEWSKTLVGMPTFTIKRIEKHRQLSGKIQAVPITKTLIKGRKLKKKKDFLPQILYTLEKIKICLK